MVLFVYIIVNVICLTVAQVHRILSAHITIIPNSLYEAAFERHFIDELDAQTVQQCAHQCLQNDFCRTAIFYHQLRTCSMYEEYSYVGTTKSTLNSVASVIQLQLCPVGFNEPEYSCFNDDRSPVLFSEMIHNMTVKQILHISSYFPFMSTTQLYLPIQNDDTIQVYDLNTFLLTDTLIPIPSISLYGFDMDSSNNFVITDKYGTVYFVNSSSYLVTPLSMNNNQYQYACISDDYIVALYSKGNGADVYYASSLQFVFSITTNYQVANCIIVYNRIFHSQFDENNYVIDISSTASAFQVFNYTACTGSNWIDLDHFYIDASGRFYVPCVLSSYLMTYQVFDQNSQNHLSPFDIAQYPSIHGIAVKCSKYKCNMAIYNGSLLIGYEY